MDTASIVTTKLPLHSTFHQPSFLYPSIPALYSITILLRSLALLTQGHVPVFRKQNSDFIFSAAEEGKHDNNPEATLSISADVNASFERAVCLELVIRKRRGGERETEK